MFWLAVAGCSAAVAGTTARQILLMPRRLPIRACPVIVTVTTNVGRVAASKKKMENGASAQGNPPRLYAFIDHFPRYVVRAGALEATLGSVTTVSFDVVPVAPSWYAVKPAGDGIWRRRIKVVGGAIESGPTTGCLITVPAA